jgi:hypothetical protein
MERVKERVLERLLEREKEMKPELQRLLQFDDLMPRYFNLWCDEIQQGKVSGCLMCIVNSHQSWIVWITILWSGLKQSVKALVAILHRLIEDIGSIVETDTEAQDCTMSLDKFGMPTTSLRKLYVSFRAVLTVLSHGPDGDPCPLGKGL